MNNKLKKIFLVDDVSFHLLNVKERLKGRYEIFPSLSAEILFDILNNVTPDLILLDIEMPGTNGYEIIKRLKENPRHRDIPVIFFTAHKDKEFAKKGFTLGAVDFITKPYSDNSIIECIDKHLQAGNQEIEKPVILAIDDAPAILREVNYLLQDNYTVYTLPQPEYLDKLLQQLTPDLFLLDYKMPKLTGFDLIPKIRENPLHEDTPIIFLTAEGTIDNITVATHLGACDFIVKPINEAVLRQKIALHLKDYIIRRRIRTLVEK